MEVEIYNQVIVSVNRLLKIDLSHYKDQQMRRRLDAWLIRSNAPNWNEYLKRLSSDSTELSRFRNYLTINVSEFFRNPDRWDYLKMSLMPDLLSQSRKQAAGLRMWSCGCSLGQETYTLAMLLDELDPRARYSILATDIDREALATARKRGPYHRDDLRNLTEAQKQKYFEPGGPPFVVREALARNVVFREQNMVVDPFENNYDLIVCRNVIIYFADKAKEILYRKFYDALRPGGILFLGGTEIIPNDLKVGFHSHGFSFYVKS